MVFHYPDVTTVRDLSYIEGSRDPSHRLDLFLPKSSTGSLPVIIDIHGGGLVQGTKELNQWTGAEMARRGYLVVTLNYPLIPQVTLHEQVQTLRRAFDFIETLAQKYPMDLDRVFLKGDSAGGLLSILLCGTQCRIASESEACKTAMPFNIKALALIHALVDTKRSDILDFISSHTAPGDLPLEDAVSDDPAIYDQPENLIPFLPPVWMVTSQNDFMFYPESLRFTRRLKHHDIRVKFHEFKYTLKKPLHHVFMISHPHLEESQMLYDSLHQFLKAV